MSGLFKQDCASGASRRRFQPSLCERSWPPSLVTLNKPSQGVRHCPRHDTVPATGPDLQAADGHANTAVCSQPRACAASLPTAEALGLLWVWPDASPGAQQQAAATPLPLGSEMRAGIQAVLDGAGGVERGATPPGTDVADVAATSYMDLGGGWFVSELPYDYSTLIENIVDPGALARGFWCSGLLHFA